MQTSQSHQLGLKWEVWNIASYFHCICAEVDFKIVRSDEYDVIIASNLTYLASYADDILLLLVPHPPKK